MLWPVTAIAGALWALTAVMAVLDWVAVHREDHRLETVAKPGTMLAMLAAAVAMMTTGDESPSTAGAWLLVALAFGTVGDVMLLSKTQARFLAGLSAFLVGHLAYVACFVSLGLPAPGWAWLALVALAVSVVVTRDVVPTTWRQGGAKLAGPVAAYTLVIGAMLLTGWLTGEPLVAAGALVFVASDTLLARDRFVRPIPHGHLAVMVTYFTGQALIVLGVLAGS